MVTSQIPKALMRICNLLMTLKCAKKVNMRVNSTIKTRDTDGADWPPKPSFTKEHGKTEKKMDGVA